MVFFIFLIAMVPVFASEKYKKSAENCAKSEENLDDTIAEDLIVVKIEEDEYAKVPNKRTSEYFGVYYNRPKWIAQRWSKIENKLVYNGYFEDEETAAHASDTLARKLMKNGDENLRLNFSNDDTEVNKCQNQKEGLSQYVGVSHHKNRTWQAQRWSKNAKTTIPNGSYESEETAAHASDTLARKLMENGEQGHKLNFPDDGTEVNKKKIVSQYIGVSYDKNQLKWRARRWNKSESKLIYNGNYDNEETAAHASDTLARNLMKNGDQNLKLNFPDDDSEVHKHQDKKRKRSKDLEYLQNNKGYKL